MAKSLYQTRKEAAERLRTQVDQFENEPDDPHTRVAEAKLLRGLPAVSRFSESSAIYGTQPGWDLFDE